MHFSNLHTYLTHNYDEVVKTKKKFIILLIVYCCTSSSTISYGSTKYPILVCFLYDLSERNTFSFSLFVSHTKRVSFILKFFHHNQQMKLYINLWLIKIESPYTAPALGSIYRRQSDFLDRRTTRKILNFHSQLKPHILLYSGKYKTKKEASFCIYNIMIFFSFFFSLC